MGLLSRHDNHATAAVPVSPPHPALASLDALLAAPLADLAAAVLVAGVAPGPTGSLNRLTASDVYARVKAAVCAAQPDLDPRDFDRRSGDVVQEGIQVLEHSLLLRIWPMDSQLVILLNRRGQDAIASAQPGRFIVAPAA